MTALHYDRAYSMESRLSWRRAQDAARDYDVTVICAMGDSANAASDRREGEVTAIELPFNRLERALLSHEVTYYPGYRLWHRRVYRLARRLHEVRPFALVHHVSLCGYREPGDCWRLGAPFIWGPIGGTQAFPLRFLGLLDAPGAAREVARNFVNACQLRLGTRVRAAMRASATVLAANRDVARSVERHFGCAPPVQLETGAANIRTRSRGARRAETPLRILWTGRLRSWKGLPILLRALAALPPDRDYALRVLGEGNCLGRWRRMATRLGIAGKIEWAGWPNYRDQLSHYDWADVFAFTSLRDTSGAGLLESLAAGVPIVGLDHQGAADIMSRDSAIAIPATHPSAAIAGFRDAMARLIDDPCELARLSEGALRRARDFDWDRQWQVMQAVYQAAAATRATEQSARGRESEAAVLAAGVVQSYC